MAGRERGGFAHATADLFRGAHYILTPDAGVRRRHPPDGAAGDVHGLRGRGLFRPGGTTSESPIPAS
ncbi:MAG: hypothetical protein ACLUI3_15860 [Christensenellales bacterium]